MPIYNCIFFKYLLHFVASAVAPFCAIPNIMDKVVKVGQLLKYDPSNSCHYM